MLVDCGAETTTVSIYKNGVLLYMSTIPMGSRNITRDITAMNYLEERAEELKIDGGNALSSTEPTPMPSNGLIDYGQINNYVAARAGEIIANINEQIKYAGLTPDRLPAGIILTGRGSKLNGFDRRLKNLTTLKVRYGGPVNRVRILDGRINASDHVDVISILAAAAKDREVKECLSRPEPVVIAPEPIYNSIDEVRQQPSPQKTRLSAERLSAERLSTKRISAKQLSAVSAASAVSAVSAASTPASGANKRPEYQNPEAG